MTVTLESSLRPATGLPDVFRRSPRIFRKFVIALAIAVGIASCIAACERRQPPEFSGGAAAERAPEASGGAVAVSREEALDASYPSENTASGQLRLVDGHYTDTDEVDAALDELEAVGDLDGDGREDRVVVLTTTTGGSGIFHELHVLRRLQGQLRISPPALLGDRVVVNDLAVERGEVVVDLIVQGPEDPLCCPTQSVQYRFRLVGDALQELSGRRTIYLKQ